MLIDVNKWIDKNGSFDEAGGLDLVRHGYEWIRRMRKFENKADRHTFQKVFGNKRGNELWDCFLEVGRSIFIDDMSGRLKWFEIDKILISFTYGVVRYVGTWGGCRTEKTLDGKLFYSSEECFKKGESIPKTRLSIYDVFESLYGFIPIGDVWKYKNGRAVKDKLEYFDVEIDDKGKIYCKETYYRTREDVYKFNGLTVVDRNGDIRLVESSKSRLMLSNDQLDVVERMKGIIDDMVRLKMIMYIDQDYNLCFLPGDKIEDLTMDETDGFVDTTGIVTSIKSKDVVEFYVENPFVKIKDE